jgi:hypothetical protein
MSNVKEERLQIRIAPNLKERYLKALDVTGISMTSHITTSILEFVQKTEEVERLRKTDEA